jgi:hypothetical protein
MAVFVSIYLLWNGAVSFSQQYPDGFVFVEVPDPLANVNPVYPLVEKEMPAIGESFMDLRFGTILTRVTKTDGIKGRHEYARFDPFNSDQSMIILNPQDLWIVYRTESRPYNQSANLVLALNQDPIYLEEPRWDPLNPNLIWGVYEFSIKTIQVLTGEVTTVKDFSQDPVVGPVIANEHVYRITMKDEGESSVDKRYWAFFLQGDDREDYNQRFIFSWDKNTDTVLGVYEIPENEINLDWVGMSPLGNYVLIGGDYDNGTNLSGLTMANRELTRFHRLDYATGHSDVGLDSEGGEVIVMQNIKTDHVDLIPIDWNTKPILEDNGGYEGTNRTPLVRLYYASEDPNGLATGGIHVSCNTPGYCVVSTHQEQGMPERNWLDRTNILVKLDRDHPRAFYLSKVYNTWSSYWEETHAAITNDGSKVVWASNWGRNIGQDQVFLMQLDMPPNWKNQLTSVNILPFIGSETFELVQNFPNPFNSETTIPFTVKEPCRVTLTVYDITGKEVALLADGRYIAGSHAVRFDASGLASGIYVYQIRMADFTAVRKMVVME